MIDIRGVSRAAVLAALYNRATAFGMGMFHYTPEDMTEQEASEILGSDDQPAQPDDIGFPRRGKYVDYLKGRCIKIDFSSANEIDETLYDRDYGKGTAQKIIDTLRKVIKTA